MNKPTVKPANPCFSSGPCAKRPGWDVAALDVSLAGRSHRASGTKAQLQSVIDKHRDLLEIPADYVVGIVPASDTGAFEMAMWSLLGARGVDVFAWESFGSGWLKDITGELKLEDVRSFEADYGALPDLSMCDFDRDVVFTWNGTTSGAAVPDGDWIESGRSGLTLCDATSAVFAYDLPWEKLDVVTWSWQKVLGSEGAHGMLALSPRAVERLESYNPPWPMPKIFRMLKKGKLNAGIFKGATINTPSMLAVVDCLDALGWVESVGGLKATMARSQESFEAIADWVKESDWVDFLAVKEGERSITSVCLTVQGLDMEGIAAMCKLLEVEEVAYDIKSYRDAPAGLRIWCGATVEPDDVWALLPWLDWAYGEVKASI